MTKTIKAYYYMGWRAGASSPRWVKTPNGNNLVMHHPLNPFHGRKGALNRLRGWLWEIGYDAGLNHQVSRWRQFKR